MPVERTSTFEQSPARRPAAGDILNGEKENATVSVPPHMPDADEYHQIAALVEAFGRMIPVLRVSVVFVDGEPQIHSFACIRGDVAQSDITLTDDGLDGVRITWTAGLLPAGGTRAMATTNAAAHGANADAEPVANGVRVRTSSLGSAVDLPFTVEVF